MDTALICAHLAVKGVVGTAVKTSVQRHVRGHALTLVIIVAKAIVDALVRAHVNELVKVVKVHVKGAAIVNVQSTVKIVVLIHVVIIARGAVMVDAKETVKIPVLAHAQPHVM